jgi:hypothetical protein
MELNRMVQVFLNPKGEQALKEAAVSLSDSRAPFFYAVETEQSGLWVSTHRADGEHLLLVAWDCIQALDVPVGGNPPPQSTV